MLKALYPLIPVGVFQSIIIAGGYGTGAEFVQIFLINGPLSGFIGLLFTAFVWSIVCGLSFHFAKKHNALNFNKFFYELLKQNSKWFEYCYLALLFIVVCVVIASSGTLAAVLFGFKYNTGILLLIGFCISINLLGEDFLAKLCSVWSILIAIVYSFILYKSIFINSDVIISTLAIGNFSISDVIVSSLKYSGYNLGLTPIALYSLKYTTDENSACKVGIFAGFIAILPGIFFYLSMLGYYPQILDSSLPSSIILNDLNYYGLTIIFAIILFGTLTQTTASLSASISNRLYEKYQFPTIISICLLLISAAIISQIGLTNLIEYGYGVATWFILILYIIPLIKFYIPQKKYYSQN